MSRLQPQWRSAPSARRPIPVRTRDRGASRGVGCEAYPVTGSRERGRAHEAPSSEEKQLRGLHTSVGRLTHDRITPVSLPSGKSILPDMGEVTFGKHTTQTSYHLARGRDVWSIAMENPCDIADASSMQIAETFAFVP